MKKILCITIFSIIAIIFFYCTFDIFDNNIMINRKINENKIDATIVIEAYSENINTAYAKIIIENNTGYDIVMNNITYSDDDLEIYTGFDAPRLTEKKSVSETVFSIEIKNVSLKESDLLKVLQNKNILINLANAYAEPGRSNIQIKPKFEIKEQ